MKTITRMTRMGKDMWGAYSLRERSLIILLLLALVGTIILGFSDPAHKKDEFGSSPRVVTVATVSSLGKESVPLPLLGTVTSRSEATIRSETGGKIIGVYKKLGDYVPAGTVIAEFENSAERAQVLSAEGAYEAATAGRDIAKINRGSSDASLAEAKTQAMNALSTTYAGLDDAVRTKTDVVWRNPTTRDAKLIVTVADARLIIELENKRSTIENMLRAREERNSHLDLYDDLISELNLIETETNIVKDYLDDLSLALNRSLPDSTISQGTIDGWKAVVGGARSSAGGMLSLITNTRNALNMSLSANKIAEKNSSLSGTDSGSSADAGVKSALGNLRGAQARLEKTIIRSPIGGTINSLSVSTGDFIPPFTQVAVVSNNGALEVLAYVTEDDSKELTVGGVVTIDDTKQGTITRIAPAIDPDTKKIEVRIGITGNSGTLTNGQSVRIGAMRSAKKLAGTDIKIPLSALKITPNGAVVFTISTSSTLVLHPVTMGALMGDMVVISEGLTGDMIIVSDARGLRDSMAVTIK